MGAGGPQLESNDESSELPQLPQLQKGDHKWARVLADCKMSMQQIQDLAQVGGATSCMPP